MFGNTAFTAIRRGTCAVVLPLFAGATLTAAAHAQQPGQRPPFLTAVEKLVEAIGDPTPARIAAVADAHFTPAYRASQTADARTREFATLRGVLGNAQLLGVEASTGQRRVILRSSVNGGTYSLDLKVSSDMPPKIEGMTLTSVGGGTLAGEQLAARLRNEVAAEVSTMGFSGVVLVTRQGETVFESAHGQAHRERGGANAPSIRYNLGSGDKLFTKIGIAQLASAGKLSLTDTVGRFLPAYPNETVRRKVTIEQLLRHTSGLGSYLAAAVDARARRIQSLADLLELAGSEQPAFEPGTDYRYSNTGYLLLGRIIEVVSGMSYFEYVQRNIFDPAGMRATGYLTAEQWPADRAMGYTAVGVRPLSFEGTERQTVFSSHTDRLPWVGSSAGGGYSTVQDLARLDRMLRQGQLMDARHNATMFMTSPDGERTLVANGGTAGVQFDYRRVGDYTIIVFANMDPPAGRRMTDRLVEVLAQAR